MIKKGLLAWVKTRQKIDTMHVQSFQGILTSANATVAQLQLCAKKICWLQKNMWLGFVRVIAQFHLTPGTTSQESAKRGKNANVDYDCKTNPQSKGN